jgi:nucleoside-diphosphate-sugar epimerase
MKIAILGAGSHLAKAFIEQLYLHHRATYNELYLFSRSPQTAEAWIEKTFGQDKPCFGYEAFVFNRYDVIVNLVGVSDSAMLNQMGNEILTLTRQFDRMALAYLEVHPNCKYVFISSGAAYGDVFDEPASIQTQAKHPIHSVSPKQWYGLSKYLCEIEHRSLPHLQIIDLRVFGFFSRWINSSTSFFLAQVARALSNQELFHTDANDFKRDFCGPEDFTQCLMKICDQPFLNGALDLYSLAPISKLELLSSLEREFGLSYAIRNSNYLRSEAVEKSEYYSINRQAGSIGYVPHHTSEQVVLRTMGALLNETPRVVSRSPS